MDKINLNQTTFIFKLTFFSAKGLSAQVLGTVPSSVPRPQPVNIRFIDKHAFGIACLFIRRRRRSLPPDIHDKLSQPTLRSRKL